MITDYKITEIFCAVDEFCKEFDKQIDKKSLMSSDGKSRRYRKASLSDSEIMTILIVFQFGSFRNFKHYYLFFIRQYLKSDFPNAVSYNRFVELQSFKLHLVCNDRGEIIIFCFTGANVDDKGPEGLDSPG